MKISKKWLRLSNMICAVLMLVLLALQFLPYWVFPACTCTEMCESKLNHNRECELCRAYYKICVLIPEDELSTNANPVDYTQEWKLSIQQYTWTPTFESCDGATEYFTKFFEDCNDKDTRATVLADDVVMMSAFDNYDATYVNNNKDYEFKVKDMVLMPVIVFVCALLGLYFCTLKAHSPLSGIIPLLAGVSGIVGYLTIPVFQINNNYTPYMWYIHMGVAALITLVSLVPITECIFRAINWCNPKKAQ